MSMTQIENEILGIKLTVITKFDRGLEMIILKDDPDYTAIEKILLKQTQKFSRKISY